jgi:hypothetical protein
MVAMQARQPYGDEHREVSIADPKQSAAFCRPHYRRYLRRSRFRRCALSVRNTSATCVNPSPDNNLERCPADQAGFERQ